MAQTRALQIDDIDQPDEVDAVIFGFRAVRVTQVWAPGERALSAQDKTVLTNVAAAAKLSNITVLTSVLISENGDVIDVKVLRGDDRFGFTDAAVRALKTARYSSPMKDGKRVKTWLPQMIQFKPGT